MRCFSASPGYVANHSVPLSGFSLRARPRLVPHPTSPWPMRPSYLYYVLPFLPVVWSSITVYHQQPFGATTTTSASGSAAAASYTGAAAYDPTILNAPPIPNPRPPTTFFQQLSSSPVPGLSIPQSGYFLGFSVEFSVINQVLGTNSTRLQVPFLNLMANLQARGGSVRVRVGGNTQDYATMFDSLPNGKMMEKEGQDTANPTKTPGLLFSQDVLHMMANISALVNVEWYLGIPMNDTAHLRLGIAEAGEAILGNRLIGLQIGNEPDQYASHQHRPTTYSPTDYSNEFGSVDAALRADSKVSVVDHKLLGPSLSGVWKPQDVWDTNFIPDHKQSLAAISMSIYPANNCAKVFGGANATNVIDPQQIFPSYLDHTAGQKIAANYLESAALAQANNLPFVMVETNTASCGGFPGVSNSFGSALWALDYGLQLAYSNFTNALLHVGGQGVYYNPFTPPPTNQSTFHQWTIGPVYYSVLAVAEAFGTSNKSRIIDLQLNQNNIYTPGYAIYDGDVLARLALFNYVTDPTGASAYTASFAIGGGDTGQPNGTPAQVKVKYLVAPSVSTKDNITWAGQTFGAAFASDGRLTGTEEVKTVTCKSDNTCDVQVPAPGFALVFLADVSGDAEAYPSVETFSTTVLTKTINTASIDPSLLATSNGQAGANFMPAKTSKGKTSNGVARFVPHLTVVLSVALGLVSVVWRTMV
ncbi:glycoside hydrolase family 79 protein [Mycena albidolilacea]|uniref:Glycoside hydrolase family 79 protein n=1 Tax=Mycena albidolilacea TaxID=1033008 RepID=A0AAD7AP40_9AGAR|nr:glycoside hydrolase family 79 protein [Mycena albidolilacea]